MPDGSSLPYLSDITINAKVLKDTDNVAVTVTWKLASAHPPLVEIYVQFDSGSDLLGHLFKQLPVGTSQPFTINFQRPNHDTSVAIGVAPRIVDPATGTVANMMPDATGEDQPWESFASQEGFELTYSSPPPPQPPAPPVVTAISVTKTLSSGDYLAVTVSSPRADRYNLIVNDGEDGAQLPSQSGQYQIPATPGVRYWLRAEQWTRGDPQPPWSPFSTPKRIDASPRQRRLRTFLSLSGLLIPGTRVRQYAAGGSTRIMMGL